MKGLIEGFLANRVAANLLMLFIMVSGLFALPQLNVRVFPPLSLDKIAITIPYPGATPAEVETALVRPVEERLLGLEGVTKVASAAAPGVASLIVDISASESMSEMLDEVKNEVARITVFPQDAREPQIAEVEQQELAAQIVLYGETSRDVLKAAAERVRSDLADLPGISLTDIGGVPEYVIEITVPEEALRARNLSLTGIAAAIGQQSLDLSGGRIDGQSQRLLVRATGERRTGEAFADVVVGTGVNGTPILLGDIATIRDGLSDDPILAVHDGKPASLVNIYRVGQEKQLAVTRTVKAYMESDLAKALPEGVEATLWRNESVYLQQRIDLLARNAIAGLALVTVLLLLFLDLRIAFWTAAGVAVCFAGAFFPMFLFGVTINQLSLFGFILAIGILVDDAIVVGENIHANWRAGAPPMEAARLGVTRVAVPVLFSVLTTVTAFVPLLVIPGVFGQFLGQISAVVIILLGLSLIESFFILPRHLSHLSSKPPGPFNPRRYADMVRDPVAAGLRRLRDGPMRALFTFVVRRPGAVAMASAGLMFASFAFITSGQVKWVFFPSVEGEYVTAELELAEGAPQAETERQAERIATLAREAGLSLSDNGQAVVGVLWSLGAAVSSEEQLAGEPGGGAAANKAFIVARIEDSGTRRFTATQFEAAWREVVGPVPGAQKLTFTSDLVSPGAPVQLQITTRDPALTAAAVARVREALAAIPGVFDVRDDRFRATDEVQVALKPLARDYGLTQASLGAEVRAALFGAEAVRVARDREEIPVRVRLPEGERGSLDALKRLRIAVPGGGYVPLESVAELTLAPAPAIISRVDGRQIFAVSAFVDERIITADAATARALNEIVPRLAPEFDGLEARLSGDQEEQAEAGPAIAIAFTLALMVIYILLSLSFKSYSQPVVIMLAIPFGFVGALIGHAMLGLNLTLLSIFGVIGLSGVIINTSIMVCDFLNERLEAGEGVEEAVVSAMCDRFRAILLTTLTTFFGVTPIIFETGVQAQFLIPTAVSLGFGILIGTTILLVVLPALLVLHLRVFRPKRTGQAMGEGALTSPAE